jgi:hypothetical protein
MFFSKVFTISNPNPNLLEINEEKIYLKTSSLLLKIFPITSLQSS